jgi:hypothetical protein
MTIEEFIELSKTRIATPEDVEAFKQRCEERNKRFKEEARKRRPDKEFMDRQYTYDSDIHE